MVLDALGVASAQALYLTAQFKIALDLFFVEDAETVDDGDGAEKERVSIFVGSKRSIGAPILFNLFILYANHTTIKKF